LEIYNFNIVGCWISCCLDVVLYRMSMYGFCIVSICVWRVQNELFTYLLTCLLRWRLWRRRRSMLECTFAVYGLCYNLQLQGLY